DIVLGSWHGGNCCKSFYLIQLSEQPEVLAFSSAEVDALGWALTDLDGDGTSELVAGFGDLYSLGCTTGIFGPLAVATFRPELGTYLVESKRWLPTYDHVVAGPAEMAAAINDRKP